MQVERPGHEGDHIHLVSKGVEFHLHSLKWLNDVVLIKHKDSFTEGS
jgi:hypothetical protein